MAETFFSSLSGLTMSAMKFLYNGLISIFTLLYKAGELIYAAAKWAFFLIMPTGWVGGMETPANNINTGFMANLNKVTDFLKLMWFCITSPFVALYDRLFSNIANDSTAIAGFKYLLLFVLICGAIGLLVWGSVVYFSDLEKSLKSTGYIFVAFILSITVLLVFYNIYSNIKNSEAPDSGLSTLAWKIMLILLIFGGVLLFMYANPIAELADKLSVYPVTIISIAVLTLLILSYNRYLFNKYSTALAMVIVLSALLIYYNPFELFTKYTAPFLITIITIVSILILLTTLFQSTSAELKRAAANNAEVSTTYMVMLALIASMFIGGFVYMMERGSMTTNPLFYIVVLFTLATIYKVMVSYGLSTDNAFIQLLIDIVFYIPCILVDIIDLITKSVLQTYYTTTKSMVVVLGIEILLLIVYLLYPYLKSRWYQFLFVGGELHAKLLVNSPLSTSNSNVIASFADLNINDPSDVLLPEFDYNYGLSMWFNMSALPPNTKKAYKQDTPIFSYGDKLQVKYNPSANKLTIVVANVLEKAPSIIYDDVTVYTNTNVMLQKWNHLVINYAGGLMDVFLNGELVATAVQVLPFMKNDTMIVGSENGLVGNICGLMYYQEPMNIVEIQQVYNEFKDKSPPKFPNKVKMFEHSVYKNKTYK